jgi:hypothetical protein
MSHETDTTRQVRWLIVVAFTNVSMSVLVGCSPDEGIRAYSAPKQNAIDSLAATRPAVPASTGLVYEAPEAWNALPVGGMRKAAFRIDDDGQAAEVTVIDLAAAAGAVLPNVNRWRQQVQLDAVTQEELDADSEAIPLGEIEATYVELVGPPEADPREAILGAIALHGDRSWFFKLKGNAELAKRERERFRAFLKSVRFGPSDGAGDGK